jgi:hypothetical protein
MKVLDLVEALMRREAVRIDERRVVVTLDVDVTVRDRFMVVDDERCVEVMSMGAVVALIVSGRRVTMAEAFVVDALRASDADASSSYLARALDALRAITSSVATTPSSITCRAPSSAAGAAGRSAPRRA